jgi:sialic acid synthase SpsE
MEIIAELAQGFEGRPELAHLLMKAAASGGADAAKYQLVFADELAAPDYKHYDLFKSLEMPDEVWEGLAAYASELGIRLQLDIFGSRSLLLAERIGAAAIKLHGTDIANAGLLGDVAQSSVRRVLLGAGGSHSGELEEALHVLVDKQVVVLLGFQGYPTPDDANQIARVRLLVERFAAAHPAVSVGFADHASPSSPLRYALAATAVGAGAVVIEKHLTLGRTMKLEDHESALNPDEFAEFVLVVRGCADAVGTTTSDDDFGMSHAEKGYRAMIRRHVVAARALPKGSTLTPTDLALKRTSAEQAVTDLRRAYTRTLKRDVQKDAPILAADID